MTATKNGGVSDGALFVGWGAIIPGRETEANAALHDAMAYCLRLSSEGRIQGFEPFLLEPHGSDLEGFMIIRGDKTNLSILRGEDEFLRTIIGVQLVHNKVRVVTAYTGDVMGKVLQLWNEGKAALVK